MLKKFFIIIALFIVIVNTGCGFDDNQKPTTASENYPVTWNETLNGQAYSTQVNTAPQRAVSMSQATTEMMLALGLKDNMVGTAFKEESILDTLQKDYDSVPVLAEKWPSYEILMATKPDFITGWEVAFTKKGIPADKLQAQNIPIYIPESMQSTTADLNTLFNDMLTLGKIFNKEDNAINWVNEQKQILNNVQNKIKDLPEKRVFVFDSDDNQPFTVFEGYTTNVLKLIGAVNVMSGQNVDKTWAKTSWENVVAANPDYIIIVDYENSNRNNDDFEQKVDKLKNNPQLKDITAIKENHFLKVKLSEITPGIRTVSALERLAKEIHELK